MMVTPSLKGTEIKRLYGALRSELNNLSLQKARNIAAAAGIFVANINDPYSRAEVMSAIDNAFDALYEDAQEIALRIIAEKLVESNAKLSEKIQTLIGKHGYQFIDGNFVPVKMLDARESKFIPSSSAAEIARATSRLISGDYTGAITAACGAIDLLMQDIYKKNNWGDPGRVSFQAKVNTSLKKLAIYEKIEKEYIDLGISKKDSSEIVSCIKNATNQAVNALQILRRAMGDTHGAKPALRKTAYDSIKWASAICGLLENSDVI